MSKKLAYNSYIIYLFIVYFIDHRYKSILLIKHNNDNKMENDDNRVVLSQ